MDFSKWSPMTVLALVVIVILLLVGGAVTIFNPDALSFNDYFNDVTKVMAALGLAVPLGRGLHFGLRDHNPSPVSLMPAVQYSMESGQTSDTVSDVALEDEHTGSSETDPEFDELPKPPRGQHV